MSLGDLVLYFNLFNTTRGLPASYLQVTRILAGMLRTRRSPAYTQVRVRVTRPLVSHGFVRVQVWTFGCENTHRYEYGYHADGLVSWLTVKRGVPCAEDCIEFFLISSRLPWFIFPIENTK